MRLDLKRAIQRVSPGAWDALSGRFWDFQAWYQKQRTAPREHLQNERSWERILAPASAPATKGAVVFFTMRGWQYHVAMETIVAARLRHMGHRVLFLDCDGELPFCHLDNVNVDLNLQRNCEVCRRCKDRHYRRAFEHRSLGALSPEAQAAARRVDGLSVHECEAFTWRGWPLGRWARDSVFWFFCKSSLDDAMADVFRAAIRSALVVADRLPNLLDEMQPVCLVMLNGDFAPERTAREIAAAHGVRYVTHELTFFNRTMVAVDASVWEQVCREKVPELAHPLTNAQRREAEAFIATWIRTRGYAGKDLWGGAPTGRATLAPLDLDPKRRTAVAFGNVTYDTAVMGKERCFASLMDWMLCLIDLFRKRPDWQLVIRCHPGEVGNVHFRTAEPLAELVRARVPVLPENVRLVGGSEQVDSYALLDEAEFALVYTSTVGLETAMRGKMAITAAIGHYVDKGFTTDPGTTEEFVAAVSRFMDQPRRLTAAELEALLRYVYYLFFERLIEFEPLTLQGGSDVKWRDASAKNLFSGRHPGVETICRAILEGKRPVLRAVGDAS